MRHISHIIIHCADTYADMDIGSEEIRRWHVARGWDDIGYHFVIRRSGALEGGRDIDGDGRILEEVGAHTLGYNQNSIGICLVGGNPDFNFTLQQLTTLRGLINTLHHMYPDAEVCGHRDKDGQKQCPGFDVASFFELGLIS